MGGGGGGYKGFVGGNCMGFVEGVCRVLFFFWGGGCGL